MSLAAIGIVALVNGTRRVWMAREVRQPRLQRTSLEDSCAAIRADVAP